MDNLVTLVAVVLGFILGEAASYVREKRKAKGAKSNIEKELEANVAMIPQRIDLLTKMKEECSSKRILSGKGVDFMTMAFDRGMGLAYDLFTIVERANLHVLYSYFKRTDEFMDTYAEQISQAIQNSGIKDPWRDYQGIIGDLTNTLKLTSELVEKFLAHKPVDVLYRETGVSVPPGRMR